jgi:hypothetical protein
MHGFYIYKKVAARDPRRIQVFRHLEIRRIWEIFAQSRNRLTAGSPHRLTAQFLPMPFLAPREKQFLTFREFDVSRADLDHYEHVDH